MALYQERAVVAERRNAVIPRRKSGGSAEMDMSGKPSFIRDIGMGALTAQGEGWPKIIVFRR